jgi:oxysterol-binding protein-related protein 3/6/7
VDVKPEHTISWTIQPHKKSINFGVFKHPGAGIAPTPKAPSASFEISQTQNIKTDGSADSQSTTSEAVEKLRAIGMKLVQWQGNCEANLVTTGKYDVPKNEGGMYGLVFDNTFAKQFSKTATLVLLTYPTNSAPQSNSQLSQSLRIKPTRSRPKLNLDRRSSDSLPSSALPSASLLNSKLTNDTYQTAPSAYSLSSNNILTGILQKRRRKRGQGHARRFFALDFTTSTLSYYHDRNSVIIRGSVPLSLAAVATNPSSREISIDSGAEVWHLKALNKKDFEAWKNALEVASQPIASAGPSPKPLSRVQSMLRANPEDDRDWAKIEALVSKISTSRDIARTLARDTDPKYLPISLRDSAMSSTGELSHYASSTDLSHVEASTPATEEPSQERRPFWKRKTSGQKTLDTKRSASAQRMSPGLPPMLSGPISTDRSGSLSRSGVAPDESLHERCIQLLRDLDNAVIEFSSLIAENKQRRVPVVSISASRASLDSVGSQEFFDAEAGEGSQLLTIQRESDDEGVTEVEDNSAVHEESSASDLEDVAAQENELTSGKDVAFPVKSRSLDLRQFSPIERRSKIPPPTVAPPSLIGFLRKNVGKDLSTISMPVTANEPISLLQKSAEQLEYSSLLDQATNLNNETERLLYVTAFAISMLSEFRVKERAIRKPFNPMLGETYELVREDRGYRFIAEKVSHRPVRLAFQADSEKWSLAQSPMPTQKFWGKSAELITEGKVRLSLHDIQERYSWTPVTCFLRNLIAGEKYVEPVGTMTIKNESNGEYTVVTFKVKGMFSGRSDEIIVQTFNASGEEMPIGLVGKWTESISIAKDGSASGRPIWTVGQLVPDAAKCYGFTTFAASLNEINERDRDAMAPTDSRRRPDQRAAENGDFDEAEEFKARLEEAQRERRKALEEQGKEWEPAWFSKVDSPDGEEVWKMKSGKDGYWDARVTKAWKSDRDIFNV